MSDNLLSLKESYIQSPSDDIQSFFWVFFWAIVQNNTTSDPDHQLCADRFKNGLRSAALHRYLDTDTGDLLTIVTAWETVMTHVARTSLFLSRSLTALSEAEHFENVEEEARYWKAAWHGLALEGVCMSLKALLE